MLLLSLIFTTCTLRVLLHSKTCIDKIDPGPYLLYNTSTRTLVNPISTATLQLDPLGVESSDIVVGLVQKKHKHKNNTVVTYNHWHLHWQRSRPLNHRSRDHSRHPRSTQRRSSGVNFGAELSERRTRPADINTSTKQKEKAEGSTAVPAPRRGKGRQPLEKLGSTESGSIEEPTPNPNPD